MTRPDLFRAEALAFRTRQRGPGAVLRVGSPWVGWLYRAVLALLVVGLAAAFSVRVDESASGPALVDAEERTFVAVLPDVARQGHGLHVEVDGLHLAAQVDRVDAAGDAEVRTAGFDSFSQPAVLVSGALTPGGDDLAALPSSPRVRGRAVIVLQSERVLTVLLRGVRGVREGGGR